MDSMSSRERIRTLLAHREPDRVGLSDSYWLDTVPRWHTEGLPAGVTVARTGTNDSDLYVRAGSAPTTEAYDCRPYTTSSNETCEAGAGAPVHVLVRGYSEQPAEFRLVVRTR